jgi:hypothetical protein
VDSMNLVHIFRRSTVFVRIYEFAILHTCGVFKEFDIFISIPCVERLQRVKKIEILGVLMPNFGV